MYFQQFYLGCLAHASYLIGSDGQAAVVDPQRDVDEYIAAAEKAGLEIRWVLETHLHADFVSGHHELAERTGAEIVFGAEAKAEFPHKAVRDGDEIRVGRVLLRVLETPGHTPESVSWLVIDTEVSNDPVKVLTGDTLFIGDVGRPDLVGSKGYTAEMMASMMYDSLHGKLLTLSDSVEVWPAHGAGSACGRNISKDRSSTIGAQRRFNWALAPMSREDFVKLMTTDLPAAPQYFGMDAEMNRRGAGRLADLSAPPLTAEKVNELMQSGATVLDLRDSTAWGAGHVPGSMHIGLRGGFAPWAGSLLDPRSSLVLVVEGVDEAREGVMRLARVGFENVAGYLEGGVAAWEGAGLPLAATPQITIDELRSMRDSDPALRVVDVRGPGEFGSGRVPASVNVPLAELPRRTGEIDRSGTVVVICQSGYRSSIATSVLERNGFRDLYNVIGGSAAWIRAGYGTEEGVVQAAS